MFDDVSRGDWDAALRRTAEDVEHVFPGDHALGGTRRSREAVRRWFERLERLFPGHEFTVHAVAARGLPHDTHVALQWTARLRPADGSEAYENQGAHWLRLRWGRVTHVHAYLDTQRVAAACDRMAASGLLEAQAAPIEV